MQISVSRLHRDLPAILLTTAAAAIAVWASVRAADVDLVRLLVLPATAMILCWKLPDLPDRRRRRFWLMWIGALSVWWVTALLSFLGAVERSGLQALHLAGYLLILVSVAARPRAASLETQQASVHRLRLSALLTALFSFVAYSLFLGGGQSAQVVGRAILPLLDLCGALLLLHLAWRLRGRLRLTCGLLGLGLSLLAALHVADLAFGGTVAPVEGAVAGRGLRAALEVLPFWCIGLAGRLRKVDQKIPATTDTRLFPLPSAVWIGLLPLLHLALDIDAANAVSMRMTVIVSTAFLTFLSVAEHTAMSRRSSRLEVERREAARQFETGSVYLESLIEHNPLAIVVLDGEHLVRLCNPAFVRTFGYSSDEVLGTSLDRIISTEANLRQASTYTARVLAGETVHAQAQRRCKDGAVLDVELWGVPLMEQDELIGIFAIYQDVTDRKRAERALRESEDRFRRLADATFEGIVLSRAGVIVDCNEQLARMMGGTVDDLIGRQVLDFVAEADRDMVRRQMAYNVEKAYEHRVVTLDGKERRVEIHSRALTSETLSSDVSTSDASASEDPSPDGRRMRVSAVRDVTAHRRLEEEMRQAQKMEAVGRLAGGIAHDFNNVLTVINGYAQLLGVELKDSQLADQVAEIREAAERASLMTQRLLAFGRKQALQPQKLDLNEVLRGTEKMLRRLIRADIELQLDLDDDLGSIRADPGQLEQVVLNLVINAGDAMPQGGLLCLRTRNLVVDLDDTGAPHAAPGTYVELEVRDSGHGMDDITRSQVFEPFFTTKEKGKGTGLGLATVYAIVQQNGGVIDVKSQVDEGTTFSILLPRVLHPEEDAETALDLPELPRGTETVLVVEDEPGVRALAREFLVAYGYEVVEAEDGGQALDLFNRKIDLALDSKTTQLDTAPPAIDLVLTDVVMPGLNGPAMARRLVADQPGLRVLFMSGYTDEILGTDDLTETWRLVQKPFTMEELLNKVRATLDR